MCLVLLVKESLGLSTKIPAQYRSGGVCNGSALETTLPYVIRYNRISPMHGIPLKVFVFSSGCVQPEVIIY